MMAKNIRMKISSMARSERRPGLSRVPRAVPDVPSARPAAPQPYSPATPRPRSSGRRCRPPQLGEAMPIPAAGWEIKGWAHACSPAAAPQGAPGGSGCAPWARYTPGAPGTPRPPVKGVHPTGGAAPSKAMPPPGAPQSTAPKRDPLQRPLPSGSHPISVRPEAVGERQQRPRSRVYFFSRSVAVDDIQHSSARGAERGSKPQKAAGATPGAAQNRRKGFPKEDFPRNKDYFFRVFNCEPSGLHHQRERRWNGNSKRSWERQWGEQSHPPPSPHPLLRAGCRC